MLAIKSAQLAKNGTNVLLRVVDNASGAARTLGVSLVFLWDHNPASLHPSSKQRSLNVADLASPVFNNGAGKQRLATSLDVQADALHVAWADGSKGEYSPAFFASHLNALVGNAHLSPRFGLAKPEPWTKLVRLPTVALSAALDKPAAALSHVATFGVCLVTDMPLTMDGTEAALRSIVGPPRETLYGGMWDTAPKQANVNDTAYTNLGLDAHTDCTYLDDTPGLQCFNCVAQAGEGGSTIVVDGYAVVRALRSEHPSTFRFFASTPLVFHHIEKNCNVRATRRVIDLDPADRLADPVQFRFNAYDLAPLTYLSDAKLQAAYEHLAVLSRLVRDERFITEYKLKVGECLVLDNRRVLHGRRAFQGYRNLIGCYVGADDWTQRLRSYTHV